MEQTKTDIFNKICASQSHAYCDGVRGDTHRDTETQKERHWQKHTDRQTDRQTRDRAGIPELQHEPVWLVIDRAVRAPVKHIEMSEHLLRPIQM